MSVRAESLQLRASVYREIRGYLDSQGFCEVSTPVRVRIPALEDTIDAIPAGSWWLRTSPELHMKRLIQAGAERIYQLGPCFRAGEHGRRHRSEFCMLEFYEGNADYRDILRRTQGLFRHVSRALAVTEAAFWGSEWEVLTVEEAFRRYTHISAVQAVEQGDFDYLLVDRIERHLGVGRPTVLIDYPTKAGSPSAAVSAESRGRRALGVVRQRLRAGERLFRIGRCRGAARPVRRVCVDTSARRARSVPIR